MRTVKMFHLMAGLGLMHFATACDTPVDPAEVAKSAPVPEIPPPPPPTLDFRTGPTDGYTGIRLVPDVEVGALDANGAPIPGAAMVVTVALANNPTGATLSGTLTVPASDGLARFTDLSIDRPGEGYTLIANAAEYRSVESDKITIVDPEPLQLITPIANTAIRQNDPTIGCPAHPYRGHGFLIRFAWIAHPSASWYRLYAHRRGAKYPIVDHIVDWTEDLYISCNGFVIQRNLDDWEWFVEALDQFGNLIETSGVGEFRFAPCRLANGQPCSAPPEPS